MAENNVETSSSLTSNGKLDIDCCLENPDIPDKDKERLRILKSELLKDDLAKNRRKKLWKEVEWVANRKKRNDHKKDERKKRRLQIRNGDREPKQKRAKIIKMAESKCRIQVALDMSLHEFMTDSERTKTAKQTQRCYAMNRRSENPLQLHLTGLENAECLTKNLTGFENWDIHRIAQAHAEHFGKDSVVYLTGDSENEIDELSESDVYIIGAMVDHNRHKGITYQRAVEAGIKHARLPLDKYVDMKSRKVLTIDHCFQILLQRANGMSWKAAILEAIPARKGAQAKTEDSDEENSDNEDKEDSDQELDKEPDKQDEDASGIKDDTVDAVQ